MLRVDIQIDKRWKHLCRIKGQKQRRQRKPQDQIPTVVVNARSKKSRGVSYRLVPEVLLQDHGKRGVKVSSAGDLLLAGLGWMHDFAPDSEQGQEVIPLYKCARSGRQQHILSVNQNLCQEIQPISFHATLMLQCSELKVTKEFSVCGHIVMIKQDTQTDKKITLCQ